MIRFQNLPQSPIYVHVADQIRAAILDRSLSSGERLPPERELAKQFGVGRSTVREALRYLQAQGLLAPRGRTLPMRTASPEVAVARFCEALTTVVQLRDVSLPDLIELRIAIEGAALTRAAESPIASHLADARAAIEVMDQINVSPAEFQQADVALHLALVAASGNQAFYLVMLAVKEGIRLRIGEALEARSFSALRPRLVAEHRALLRAVESGNAKSAAVLLRKHLSFYGT